jgi:hypothetical protein
LETEATVAGLGGVVEKLERLLDANRYTSKEVWKRDWKGRFGELIWAGQYGLDGRRDVVHHEDCWLLRREFQGHPKESNLGEIVEKVVEI